MDLLQISGLVNYYGRTPESDNIQIKPVLLQKGRTKLALYGMSNVRDERLFRTFRDGKVKFFQPGTQKQDWFNLMSVHQNHHAYTETGYLPENFLPDFIDLVVWGHEHECLIDPKYNPEMNFHVMQPGSSVATSLMPGEAVPKQVAILSITGRDFTVDTIRLKTVRPFVVKEIVLSEEKEAKKWTKGSDARTRLTQYLVKIVEGLIEQANAEWREQQDQAQAELDEESGPPLPLVRLRVEYTTPDGGSYDCENPQRFSNRFVGKVANVNDVVQFYRKKSGGTKKAQNGAALPEESILAQLSIDSIKVEKLVREFLTAQSLTILPQNSFGDAVTQFVDKDDKHAMEMFVTDSLGNQIKHLLEVDQEDDEGIQHAMDEHKSKLEELFNKGHLKVRRKKLKPKPDTWDSDIDDAWSLQPAALYRSDEEPDPDSDSDKTATATRVNGSRSARGSAEGATAVKKKAAPRKPARGKKQVMEEYSDEEEENGVGMIDENEMDDDDDESQLFVKQKPAKTSIRRPPSRKAASPAKRNTRAAPATAKQAKLNFSQPTQAKSRATKTIEVVDDEISDDDEAFGPVPTARSTRSRR